MKLLIISDIHGNYHALRAVIQAVAHDRMLCCGDLVVGCPFPQQCIDAVKDGGGPVCTGNHDDAVAHARKVSDHLPEQLAHYGPVLDRAATLTRGQIMLLNTPPLFSFHRTTVFVPRELSESEGLSTKR